MLAYDGFFVYRFLIYRGKLFTTNCLDSIGNPIFKPIKTGLKHVMVIVVPLTLGTLGT